MSLRRAVAVNKAFALAERVRTLLFARSLRQCLCVALGGVAANGRLARCLFDRCVFEVATSIRCFTSGLKLKRRFRGEDTEGLYRTWNNGSGNYDNHPVNCKRKEEKKKKPRPVARRDPVII